MLQPLNPSRSSVLLVEDSPDDAAVLARALETYGIKKLFLAESAEDALRLLEEQPCDVVLVDYRLPGMDGLRLLERIRESWPDTTALLVTGQRDEQIAATAMKMGAADYVAKDELLTSGIIRSLQTALRDRGATHDQERRELLASGQDKFRLAREEADWLLESLARDGEMHGFQPAESIALERASEGWNELVHAFGDYLEKCFERFPEAPTTEEDSLLRMLMSRGLSPREVVEVHRTTVRSLAAGGEQPVLSPSLCLVRLLAKMTEHYQREQSLAFRPRTAAAPAWSTGGGET